MERESGAGLEQGRGVATMVVGATLRVKGSSTGIGGAPVERESGVGEGAGQGCGHHGGWGHTEGEGVLN